MMHAMRPRRRRASGASILAAVLLDVLVVLVVAGSSGSDVLVLAQQEQQQEEEARQPQSSETQPILTELAALDQRYGTSPLLERRGNVDVLPDAAAAAADDDTKNIGICNLIHFMPYTYVDDIDGQRKSMTRLGVTEGSLGVFLAAHHLNAGDGSIVPEVAGLPDRCNVRFAVENLDSERNQRPAVDRMIDLLGRRPGLDRLPCAILGNGRTDVSMATSVLSGLAGYPQISPLTSGSPLDEKSQFPLFGRVIPSSDGVAVPTVLWFDRVLKVKHLAVINFNDSYGNAYVSALQRAVQEYAPHMVLKAINIPRFAEADDIVQAISIAKETKFRYFFTTIGDKYEGVMEEAYRQGIAGTGKHNWIFAKNVFEAIKQRTFERNSPLHLALRGTAKLTEVGGMPGMEGYDKFIEQWKSLNNPEDVQYVMSKQPTYPDEPSFERFNMNDNSFESAKNMAPFLYDATIALGLAACNVTQGDDFFDGRSHYDAFKRMRFTGATGDLFFEQDTGSRDPNSALFQMFNYAESPESEGSDEVSFVDDTTALFQNGEWIVDEPFVYNDGTTVIRPDLPDISVDYKYIGTGLRAAGLVLCAVVMLQAIGFALFTKMNQTSRVVKASQPVFLYIICLGTLIMSAAIIPLSIDDEIASVSGCSIACQSVPWLICIGFSIAFASILSKTLRINKIFHNPSIKRIKITARDVAKPIFASLALNVLVLSLWTGLSPLHWSREVTAVDEFNRAVTSNGFCTSEGFLPYVITLVIGNVGLLALALYQVYNARSLSTEFAESEYIFKALFISVLVCFVGIPVMIIVEGEPKAYFFLLSSIIFVLCSALLLFMFVPKIIFHFDPEKGKQKDAVRQFVSKKYSQNSTASWTANSTAGTDQRKLSVSSVQSFSGTDINKENAELKETIASLRARVSELENLIAKGVEEQDGNKEKLPVEANVDSPIALEQV